MSANFYSSLTIVTPWATIILTAVLWSLNKKKERKQERFKKLIDIRIKVLSDTNDFFDALINFTKLQNPTKERQDEIQQRVNKLRREIQQCGHDEEIEMFEQFGRAAFYEKNVGKANEILSLLIPLITNNIRKELGLPETNIKLR